ncbi:cobalamin-binding protein [Rubrobacter xylanophilus]|uniref:Cobalamin-binding protein n=1 Tax=Rubrobacter xylanophilus TaxID=49319 RepID=A0A510HKT6_9ACTN|nr:cobalamin-binding protein [Rubrobacter xylanophilus]BBL80572.1 cobalamin-binding protein [Rubrobacter xylanophilus]
MRTVSLLPAATEMVCLAGAREALVGVTHECDHPPEVRSLPRLTSSGIDHHGMTSAEVDAAVRSLTDGSSLYSLDAALLRRLEPDLVITQGLCEVCAVSPGVVERAISGLPRRPEVLSLDPSSLEEVLSDTVRVGEALGRGREARRKTEEFRRRLRRVARAVAGRPRPRVACLEWLDPPYSAGHWVPEMVGLAGGEPLFAAPGEPSRRMGWEEVAGAAPEAIVLMPCGFDVRRTLQEAGLLARMPGWEEIPAVREGRVWAVDANAYFSRPGPRLVRGVELLAALLHPEAPVPVPRPDEAARLTREALTAR